MRLLLDAHAFLWWVTDDERLGPAARQAVTDPGNEVFVSAASAWEIATKQRLGKLDGVPRIGERYGEWVGRRLSAPGGRPPAFKLFGTQTFW